MLSRGARSGARGAGGRGGGRGRWWAAGAGAVLAATAAGWITHRRYVAITVVGESMSPALPPGSRVLIRRGTGGLRRGRVAVLASPHPATAWRERAPVGRDLTASWVIKRVAAVAGDPMPPRVAPAGGRVPAGHVVVLGDHPVSQDSKQYGPCPVDQVLGVVVRRL